MTKFSLIYLICQLKCDNKQTGFGGEAKGGRLFFSDKNIGKARFKKLKCVLL